MATRQLYRLCFIFSFFISVPDTALTEDIHRWTDDQGQIHFSFRKPHPQEVPPKAVHNSEIIGQAGRGNRSDINLKRLKSVADKLQKSRKKRESQRLSDEQNRRVAKKKADALRKQRAENTRKCHAAIEQQNKAFRARSRIQKLDAQKRALAGYEKARDKARRLCK